MHLKTDAVTRKQYPVPGQNKTGRQAITLAVYSYNALRHKRMAPTIGNHLYVIRSWNKSVPASQIVFTFHQFPNKGREYVSN
jgi:hypothetical protein